MGDSVGECHRMLVCSQISLVCNVWLQEFHFTDTHLSFGFLELMSNHRYLKSEKAFGSDDEAPIGMADVTGPVIELNVPLHWSWHPIYYLWRTPVMHMEELLAATTGNGVAYSKAARRGKLEGKGEYQGKGEGKGKDTGIPEADKGRRSRSRSRRHVEP